MNKKVQGDGNEDCFAIVPISDQPNYEPDHFLNVYIDLIEPAVRIANFVPKVANRVKETNIIHLDILQRILEAPICICDLSSRNPNVMFELGLRQAFDMPVVLIKDDKTDSPFDVHVLRHIDYNSSLQYRGVVTKQKEIAEALRATHEMDKETNYNSVVRLLGIQKARAVIPKNPEDLRLAAIEVQLQGLSGIVEVIRDILARRETTAVADTSRHGSLFAPEAPTLSANLNRLGLLSLATSVDQAKSVGAVANELNALGRYIDPANKSKK
ncbi:MAG: hypothetical protein F9K44_07630 [Hyphomicrobiaceae bacterium]|nr:MAG: hypothetical protein F9K44_07630 [Hyphomicrobiaceae bacterium]